MPCVMNVFQLMNHLSDCDKFMYGRPCENFVTEYELGC
jgi:hypothetical protein